MNINENIGVNDLNVRFQLAENCADEQERFNQYIEIADLGHIKAQMRAGYLYDTEKKYDLALKYYLKVTKQDTLENKDIINIAHYNLGIIYAEAKGVNCNYSQAIYYYEQSADQGNSDALYQLGRIYENGRPGIPKDELKAIKYYRNAAAQGQQSAIQCLKHLETERDRQYGLVRKLAIGPDEEPLKRAANLDHRIAQYLLARRYKRGTGSIKKDILSAVKWFSEAAAQGDPDAQYQLGKIYEKGRSGLLSNDKESIKYYRQAAAQGHEKAKAALIAFAKIQLNFGKKYDTGEGVAVDQIKAVEYYREAAELGNASAQNRLGLKYEVGAGGLTQSYFEAAKLYKLAADQGNVSAHYNLGDSYEKGLGVTKNYTLAIRYYTFAAMNDHASAKQALDRLKTASQENQAIKQALDNIEQEANELYDLGIAFQTPNPSDNKDSVEYFTGASNLGSAHAQYFLGFYYQCGYVVSQNTTEAIRLYKQSADQDCVEAQYALAQLYEEEKNIKEAIGYYAKASVQNHEQAKEKLKKLGRETFDIGWRYKNSLNRAKAAVFFKIGADHGHALSQLWAGVLLEDEDNFIEAFRYYKLAAKQGVSSAFYELGKRYEDGRGVNGGQSYSKALKYYTLADFHRGHAAAIKEIARLKTEAGRNPAIKQVFEDFASNHALRKKLYRIRRNYNLKQVNGFEHEKMLKDTNQKHAIIVGEENANARRLAEKCYNETSESIAEIITDSKIVRARGRHIDYIIEYNNNPSNPVITIAFRGTEKLSHDWHNVNAKYEPKWFEEFSPDVEVHGGFLEEYRLRRDRKNMFNDIALLLNRNELKYSQTYFIFSGHSMGGSIATLAAAEFKKRYKKDVGYIGLVTVSSPRTLSTFAAELIEKKIKKKNIMRWWCEGDYVPSLPFESFGMKHIGHDYCIPPLKTRNPLKHHSIEPINLELFGEQWRNLRNPNHKGWDQGGTIRQSFVKLGHRIGPIINAAFLTVGDTVHDFWDDKPMSISL